MGIWSYLGPLHMGAVSIDADCRRQTSPNDEKKHLDVLVWNKTEKLLMPAEADVLEVFDW